MPKQRASCLVVYSLRAIIDICICCRDGGYEAHEDQLRAEYAKQIQSKTRETMGHSLPRELCWKDVRNITLKRHFSALMYPVTARNDEVLIVKAFNGAAADGAILGVELKKKLTRQVNSQLQFVVGMSYALNVTGRYYP
jgi:hypothetical protein